MPTLADVKLNALFTMLKGEPGTRKSTAALSYPTPQYWFSHDRKMPALILPMKRWGINARDVNYDSYRDYAAMEMKMKQLQTNCSVKTIVVDSITSTGDSINNQTKSLKSGTTKRDGSEAGIRIAGIEVNSLEDYKAEASGFQEIVDILSDIKEHFNVNIILIAHVVGSRSPEEQSQSTHFARIIVTGGKVISAKIPAYCEEVYHFNIHGNVNADKEGEYALKTRHTGGDFARTCLPLPAEIIVGDKPLYDTWIKPAIISLEKEVPVTKL